MTLTRRCLGWHGVRCIRPAIRGESRCAYHHAAARAGYGGDWSAIRANAIAMQPWCSECGTQGDAGNPLTGDHRVPLEHGGTAADGVDVLCRRCNASRGRAQGMVAQR